jgi:hypothetical protein
MNEFFIWMVIMALIIQVGNIFWAIKKENYLLLVFWMLLHSWQLWSISIPVREYIDERWPPIAAEEIVEEEAEGTD